MILRFRIRLETISFFILLSLLTNSTEGQNLISNPSFEINESYPSDTTSLFYGVPFKDYCDYWYGIRGTPDWMVDISPTKQLKAKYGSRIPDRQKARTGIAVAGFLPNEPIVNPLKKKLKKDSIYCIKAWMLLENGQRRRRVIDNPADKIEVAFNKDEKDFRFKNKNEDLHFHKVNDLLSSKELSKISSFGNVLNLETTYLSNGNLLDSKEKWTEVKGVYKAKGHEVALILNKSEVFSFCYYLVDDVSLYRVRNEKECRLEPIELVKIEPEVVDEIANHEEENIVNEKEDVNEVLTSIPESSKKVLARRNEERLKADSLRKQEFSHALEISGLIRTSEVLFPFNTAEIRKESYKVLNTIGEIMVEHANIRFNVIGHTDSIGGKEYHLSLSLKRSQSVREYLITRFKIDGDRMVCFGMGDEEPLKSNETEEGRKANRRVEFQILKD